MQKVTYQKISKPKKKELVDLMFSDKLYHAIYKDSTPRKTERDLLEWLNEMIGDGIYFYKKVYK